MIKKNFVKVLEDFEIDLVEIKFKMKEIMESNEIQWNSPALGGNVNGMRPNRDMTEIGNGVYGTNWNGGVQWNLWIGS